MHISTKLLPAAALGLSLQGCATPRDGALDRWLDAEALKPLPAASEARWREAADDALTETNHERLAGLPGNPGGIPGGIPGVGDYVAAVLARNPQLRAAELNVQRLQARVAQAESFDDPMLTVSPVGQMAQTAAGEVGLMAGVSQKLPWPGKRDARGQIAAQDAAMAAADLAQLRLELTQQTQRAYWSLYAAARSLEVTAQSRDLLERLEDSITARYQAGGGRQVDLLRTAVELSTLDDQQLQLLQQRANSEAMLNRLLDQPITTPLPPPEVAAGDAADDTAVSLEHLLQTATATQPALQQLRAKLEQDRQRMRLAKLSRRPDVTVGVNYSAVDEDGLAVMANGDDQWWLSLGINLPLWTSKYDAAEREALRGRFQTIAQLQATQNRVDFAVRDAYDRLQTLRQRLDLLQTRLIPEARQAVDVSLREYEAGEAELVDVLADWQRQLAFEQMQFDYQAQVQQAAANLAAAVG